MPAAPDVPGVAVLLAEGWVEVDPDLWQEWPEALRRSVPDTRPEAAPHPLPDERGVLLVRPLGPRLAVPDVRVLLSEMLEEPPLEEVHEPGPSSPRVARWREARAALLREPVDALVDRWQSSGPGGRLHAAWEATGVHPVASSPWRQGGADPDLRASWREAGVPDEEALAWLESRPETLTPDVRAAYVQATGGDAAEALAWSRAEVDVADVAGWRDAAWAPGRRGCWATSRRSGRTSSSG